MTSKKAPDINKLSPPFLWSSRVYLGENAIFSDEIEGFAEYKAIIGAKNVIVGMLT